MGNESKISNKPAILNIDTEFGWRGGQQQAVYLYEKMIANRYKTLFVCQPHSDLRKYFKRDNLPFISIPMYSELDFLAGFRIARYCQKYNYNILHLHSAHALSIGILAKLFNPNLILIGVRRVDFSVNKNFISKFKYNNSLLDKIVCISNGIKKVLLKDGIKKSKLITIHSGINTKKFNSVSPFPNFKEKFNIPQDNIIIGTVAALVGHKDYPNLLQAAKMVTDEIENATFIALGKGEDEQKIKEIADNLNLKNKFKFLGFRENVGEFLKQMDIFVLASKLEGMGTSILDAEAVGLPVIGTNAGGIPEVIRNRKNGLIVPKQNSKELAKAIIKLVNDKNMRENFGEKSKEFVREFSVDKNFYNYVKLYRNLIKSI
ncbi:MAG: glycosyltransferase [Candidatus Cloacimonetes bacterium]|nr:glycosyltransferase [Candidatus Cloacimonadota bacterium]MBS3766816.1 glycosyltransferase [Candidatus Cloacimonadota bacterium]